MPARGLVSWAPAEEAGASSPAPFSETPLEALLRFVRPSIFRGRNLLDSFRRGQRWLTFIFVSVIGIVFVFFMGFGGGSPGGNAPTGNAVVQLDDIHLTRLDFEREKANSEARLRAELGEAYEQLGADRYLDSQALSGLVNQAILATAARELGLEVTKTELQRYVQASPAFIDDKGRFDPTAFDRFAAYNYGSQRNFIQTTTREFLGQKLVQLLLSQAQVSDAEVDLRARYELEEVRIAYVAIDPNALPDDVVIAEEAALAYADDHEEELTALYEARLPELAEPERVRARHILIRAAEGVSDSEVEAASEKAKLIRDRIVGGEDFAAVAVETSEDVGTAAQGGDLGTFARGDNDPAIDDTAFALEVGTLSEVVRSSYGFHVLLVEEKLEASTPSFDDLRAELALEAAESARALELSNTRADRLVAAIEAGQSLEEAAALVDISVERPPAMKRRRDGFITGLGGAGEVLSAAFALEPGKTSPVVYDVEGRRVLVQVLERTTPDDAQIASERANRRDQILVEKQNQIISAWLDDYRTRLENEGRLRVNAELALGS